MITDGMLKIIEAKNIVEIGKEILFVPPITPILLSKPKINILETIWGYKKIKASSPLPSGSKNLAINTEEKKVKNCIVKFAFTVDKINLFYKSP